MHHKRRRPKNRRRGCIMCKPWKMNGAKPGWFRTADRRRNEADRVDEKSGENDA